MSHRMFCSPLGPDDFRRARTMQTSQARYLLPWKTWTDPFFLASLAVAMQQSGRLCTGTVWSHAESGQDVDRLYQTMGHTVLRLDPVPGKL